MSTATYQVNPNGAILANGNVADIHEIQVGYDPTSGGVSVNPGLVDKGTTVRFKDPAGGKVRIVFLSPEGNPSDIVCDSDSCTMLIGGVYHFLCYFTPLGADSETPARTGGVLEVHPPRP
ncbi:MAG TPA: hypothetical protein VI636_17870 [Candidatus Angelobacter sp.]